MKSVCNLYVDCAEKTEFSDASKWCKCHALNVHNSSLFQVSFDGGHHIKVVDNTCNIWWFGMTYQNLFDTEKLG